MKIYSRSGDGGQTSLGDGRRVKKNDNIINALGDLDELNCAIGFTLNFLRHRQSARRLSKIQNLIFNIGAEIARGSKKSFRTVQDDDVFWLEKAIDQMTRDLPPLHSFILPGGSKSGAILHLTRAICRRVERSLTELQLKGKLTNDHVIPFFNRLSDFLFVAARWENKTFRSGERQWSKD